MSGWEGEIERGWHMWNVKGRKRVFELTSNEMITRTATVHVLNQAAQALLREEVVTATAPLSVSLYELVIASPGTWENRREFVNFRERAREMFPPR